MKKLLIIALASISMLGLNAQTKVNSELQKQSKQIEQKGKEKANELKGMSQEEKKKAIEAKQNLQKQNIKTNKESKQIQKEVKKEEHKLSKDAKDALKDKTKVGKEKLDKNKVKEIQPEVANEVSSIENKEKKKIEENVNAEKEKHDSKAKAHGKDKGELSGKEFGKERAEQAKLNQLDKKKTLNTSVSTAEIQLSNGNDKVNAAKEKLEADKAAGTISKEEYNAQAERIKKAEMALKNLAEKIKKGKSMK